MEPTVAAEHLQVIRTLMERSALYRRALAPIMSYVGVVGIIAAAVGWSLAIDRLPVFVAYWFAVAALALTGALLLVRRQAFQQAEPFWSPPTRRVGQAVLPPLIAGFAVGVLSMAWPPAATAKPGPPGPADWLLVCLPLAWVTLYGCAMHAAGFFATRGMRLFGYALVLGGCAAFIVARSLPRESVLDASYGMMGFFFGILHLAYGVYLYFTEPRRNAS